MPLPELAIATSGRNLERLVDGAKRPCHGLSPVAVGEQGAGAASGLQGLAFVQPAGCNLESTSRVCRWAH